MIKSTFQYYQQSVDITTKANQLCVKVEQLSEEEKVKIKKDYEEVVKVWGSHRIWDSTFGGKVPQKGWNSLQIYEHAVEKQDHDLRNEILTYMLEQIRLGFCDVTRTFYYNEGLIYYEGQEEPVKMEGKHKIFGVQIGEGKVKEITDFKCASEGLKESLIRDKSILEMAKEESSRLVGMLRGDLFKVVKNEFHGNTYDFTDMKRNLVRYIKEMSKMSTYFELIAESYKQACNVRKVIRRLE